MDGRGRSFGASPPFVRASSWSLGDLPNRLLSELHRGRALWLPLSPHLVRAVDADFKVSFDFSKSSRLRLQKSSAFIRPKVCSAATLAMRSVFSERALPITAEYARFVGPTEAAFRCGIYLRSSGRGAMILVAF